MSGKKIAFFSVLIVLLCFSTLYLLAGSMEIKPRELIEIFKFEKQCLSLPSSEIDAIHSLGINNPALFKKQYDIDYKHSLVVREFRLPRYLLALLSGGALAIAGASLQGLFRNPLADPSLIGVSSGASLGTVALMVFGGKWLSHTVYPWNEICLLGSAFLAGLMTTYLVYSISRSKQGKVSIGLMLLAGVAVTAFASSLISCVIYFSQDTELRRFTYWSLGNLNAAGWHTLSIIVPIMLPSIIALLCFAKPLNALALGEAEAQHLGVNVAQMTRRIILFSSLLVGSTVAVCGIISFIGLIVPHCVRLIIGPNHRSLLPASLILGAITLVYSDWVTKILPLEQSIPAGLITALLGAPFFLMLLYRERIRLS